MRTPQEIHDAKYFFNFFKRIPNYRWCPGRLNGSYEKKCALGHLGIKDYNVLTNDAERLAYLFNGENGWRGLEVIYHCNDSCRKIGRTFVCNPKRNILRKLARIIKNKE